MYNIWERYQSIFLSKKYYAVIPKAINLFNKFFTFKIIRFFINHFYYLIIKI